MLDSNPPATIEQWLNDVRVYAIATSPDLVSLLDTYSAEAIFGRRYIAEDIKELNSGSTILEIGAGSLLLSCQLVREGFRVTALEPIGDGFSHFEQLRQLILNKAREDNCVPRLLDITAETLDKANTFHYAFSINVMEHVASVEKAIHSVGNSLVTGATFRFTCPNYLFPYEPHFNIPTFFSKKWTAFIMRKKIFECNLFPDAAGTWSSLNWITVPQVKKIVRDAPWLECSFDRKLLVSTFERVAFDKNFANRRSLIIRGVITVMVELRMHYLLQLIPAMFQPIMDCKLQKLATPEARLWHK